MTSSIINHVGMDVHKKQHQVAFYHPQSQKLTEFTINSTDKDVKKTVKRIIKESPGEVMFYYEAGCLGFALKRKIEAAGAQCKVIAPSLVPVKPGERVKTDRIDARKLLDYAIAGQLTEVHAPNAQQEAVRDLCRLRDTAQRDLTRTKHRISKFMLRYGFAYHDGSQWTQKHLRWLKGRDISAGLGNDVLADMLEEYEHRQKRVKELTGRVEQVSKEAPYREPVGWLCCLKGIDTMAAMTFVTELFNFERFSSPKQLMGYLGLVPSEHSSGESRKTGGITKTGNGRVRSLLVQCAWHQRHKPYVGQDLKKRRAGQEKWVIDIANKCMKRLYRRHWYLVQKGKPRNCANTAVARELVGFIWSILYTWIGIAPENQQSV